MMTPGHDLDLVAGLAAALVVHFHWHVVEMRNREKAQDEQTTERVVNVDVLVV
jgi:hypothetical protein